MAPRLELQALLEELLGSRNVYFSPPPDIQMKYPCIVYKRDSVDITHASNLPYKHMTRYQVTIITEDPDDITHKKVGLLPTVRFDRNYVADKLNHDVYTLFF
jgi:hypothetical protein